MHQLLYRLCRHLAKLLALLFHIRSSGSQHVPKNGPALLAFNHISHFDPPFITTHIRRDIDFMTSAEFFKNKWARWFLNQMNAFPIDRTRRDLNTVKVTLDRLAAGRVVGIFVEGGIRHGDRSVVGGAPLGPGSSAIAQVANVPLIPGILLGTDQLYQWRNWFRRPRVFFRFGPPLIAQPDESREALAQRLTAAMRALYEEMKRDYKIKDHELPHSAQERWKQKR